MWSGFQNIKFRTKKIPRQFCDWLNQYCLSTPLRWSPAKRKSVTFNSNSFRVGTTQIRLGTKISPIYIWVPHELTEFLSANSEGDSYWWWKVSHLRQRQAETGKVEWRSPCANVGQARIDGLESFVLRLVGLARNPLLWASPLLPNFLIRTCTIHDWTVWKKQSPKSIGSSGAFYAFIL